MGKSDADYLAMYFAVRPYVTWRTRRQSGFPPPLKAKITRAFNELERIRRSGLVPVKPPRRRGEKIGAYRRRVARIKRANDAVGSPLAAAPARVSSTETVEVIGTRIVVTKKTTTRTRRQWFIPVEGPDLASPRTRLAEVRRVWDEAVDNGATRLRLALGPRRMGAMDFYEDFDDFFDAVDDESEKYGESVGYALVGVYASA